jgi:hypothetical protein
MHAACGKLCADALMELLPSNGAAAVHHHHNHNIYVDQGGTKGVAVSSLRLLFTSLHGAAWS